MIVSTPSTHRRVSIVTPTARVDLVVPGALPIAELLPVVTELARLDEEATWQLGRVGHPALSVEQSLDSAGVRDGELLDLRPSSLSVPEPVYDEITDAAAAVAAEQITDRAGPGPVPMAVAAGLTLVWAIAWAWWNRPTTVGTSAVLAVTLLAAAVVAGRRLRRELVATGLGTASIAFAAVAASGAVPVGTAPWSVVAATTTVAAVVVGPAIRGSVPVFAALCAAGTVAVGAGIAAQALSLSAVQTAVGTVVVVVAVLPMVPRWSAHVAGLPRHHADEPDAVPAGARLAAVLALSRRALGVAIGLHAAFGCAISGAGLVLVNSSGPWAISLAVVSMTLLLLRSRSVDVPRQAWALAVPAVAGLVTAGALLALRSPVALHGWLPGAAVVAAGVALRWAGPHPARPTSPAAQRLLRLLEGVLVLAVVPLAVAAVQGYSRLRHL